MSTREFKTDDGKLKVSSQVRDGLLSATVGDAAVEGPLQRFGKGEALFTTNGIRYRAAAVEHKGVVWVALNGRVYRFEDARSDDEMGASTASENSVAAPMPGKVIKLLVAAGDEVEEGQPVVIVEAMKMEHTLRAPSEGTIVAVHCEDGQQVDAGVPLVEVE